MAKINSNDFKLLIPAESVRMLIPLDEKPSLFADLGDNGGFRVIITATHYETVSYDQVEEIIIGINNSKVYKIKIKINELFPVYYRMVEISGDATIELIKIDLAEKYALIANKKGANIETIVIKTDFSIVTK